MSWLKTWWTGPDQYQWITAFLQQRGMLRLARTNLAFVAGLAALVPLTHLASRPRIAGPALVVDAVTIVYTVGMVVFWLFRWPTRRQSRLAVVIGVLCIGGWGLAEPNAAFGTLACMALAVTGGYSAVFHSPRLVMLHSVATVAIAAGAGLRLSQQTGVPAVSVSLLVAFVTLSVPLGFWGMSRGIRMYARRSDEDGLTGLLNRRALTGAVGDRLANPPPAHTHLAVLMVDLDNFKRLNDTHGHLAGDDALRAVAQLLRQHSPAEAIICRAGGEEFLIALTTVSGDVLPLAAEICAAIAGLVPRITASIGIASVELRSLTGPGGPWLVEELIEIADQAMYAAKRNGGNRAQCASAGDSPLPTNDIRV
jgi:diguanylate cyclase (GGDEF)-like protein